MKHAAVFLAFEKNFVHSSWGSRKNRKIRLYTKVAGSSGTQEGGRG
jgi:hypothetical protein